MQRNLFFSKIKSLKHVANTTNISIHQASIDEVILIAEIARQTYKVILKNI